MQLSERFQSLPVELKLADASWDVAAVLFIIAFIFMFGMSVGRQKLFALVFAVYAAAAVAGATPAALSFLVTSGVRVPPYAKAASFILFTLVFTFLFAGRLLPNIFRFSSRGMGALWQAAGISLLSGGLFVSLFLQFLPYTSFVASPPVEYIFRRGAAPFLWTIAPLLFLILLRSVDDE